MGNKLLSILLVFVVIIGVFTFRTNYEFSSEMYLTNISEFEERPEFPSFEFTATTSLSDYIDSVDDAEIDTSKLLRKIFNSIYQTFLRLGYIFTVLYDIGYWIVNVCIYIVRMIVWFVKLLGVIFINPSIKVDSGHYNGW